MSGFDRREILTALGMTALAPSLAWGQTATVPAMLPKGMSNANFSAALGALRSIVGPEWVFADETSLLPYKKAMIPDVAGKHVPIGAVAPANVEQVQQIVQVANRYKLPLWPVSTGKNMGYGMTNTAAPGQTVLDLKRMNKIISVDSVLCTALVEPASLTKISPTISRSTISRSGSMCQRSDRSSDQSAIRWIAASATRPTASISQSSAGWKSF